MSEPATRCGFVAVIGAPNAGKSTLVNRLVGAKVSIVTHKVQTTRARVRGVAVKDRTQIVYIDTPGIFAPRRRLDRAMVAAAWDGAAEADATLFLVDAGAYRAAGGPDASAAARRSAEDVDRIVEALKGNGAKVLLALNKIDQIPRQALLDLAQRFDGTGVVDDLFMISAETGDGVGDLEAALLERMPEGPWMFPEDQLSDVTDRLLAAEITREKLFLRLHQEIPYDLTVETERWETNKKGEIRIEQIVYVKRDSQKALVLGRGGATVKAVGAAARAELSQLLETPVHLFLTVKTRERWEDEPARYREMGLDFAG
ncbi:MAG: GTPase Era [Pseudomonadota bacterium]